VIIDWRCPERSVGEQHATPGSVLWWSKRMLSLIYGGPSMVELVGRTTFPPIGEHP